MFDELKKMNEELAELKKNHLERSKKLFTEVTVKVFEKHPALESFSWNQYTPYFNDGEECTFSANIDYPEINDSDENDDGAPDYFNETKVVEHGKYNSQTRQYEGRIEKPNPDYSPELVAAKSDVIEFLGNIDDSVLRDLFGDHVKVTVTKMGTEVDGYEHD